MDMKDQKLATEIAEERMTLIAPLLSQNLDKDSVRLIFELKSVSETKFPKGHWNAI